MRRALVVALMLAAPAAAQTDRARTLADIRQDLAVLSSEMDALRAELSTTVGPRPALPGTALERVDAIEAELRRLTAAAEALDARVDRVVRDGTNRVADLEFRIAELAGGDLAALPETPPLGGEAAALAPAPAPAPPEGAGAQMAMGEQADYDRALEAFEAADYAEAARALEEFARIYPGGTLASRAEYRRGLSLERIGDLPGAARAYLAAFSGNPNGGDAPDALYRLAVALRELGQTQEACITLGEVQTRFPGLAAADMAAADAAALECFE